MNDRVAFLGQVPNVEHWMARAGLVVQPSRFEGFPNAVLEAMATGAPVISADCPSGPSDLISQDVNGVLVPPEDVDALSVAMRRLLLDEQLRLRLGARAREVRERFSADRIMAQWSSFVETAMPRKKTDGK